MHSNNGRIVTTEMKQDILRDDSVGFVILRKYSSDPNYQLKSNLINISNKKSGKMHHH